MRVPELVIWSMALGAIAAVAAGRLADLLLRPAPNEWPALAYHALAFGFVLVLSPLPAGLGASPSPGPLHLLQVLAGPVCSGISNYWIRDWLHAAQRDRMMASGLVASALLLPLVGVACLALPAAYRLPAAAAASLLGSLVTLWMTVRAWLMGDRLAGVMAVGSAFTLATIGGMYWLAIGLPADTTLHVLVAACAVAANGLVGVALWLRSVVARRARHEGGRTSGFDPVTKVHGSIALVHRLIKAQRRRRRTRRDGAVLAIMVFDLDRLGAQAGPSGLNEMFIAVAARIQRQVGVMNFVARYYERCFVSVVETIESPAWLRTLGLRVAASLRRPIEVTGPAGERVTLRPEIGVGLVHLRPGSDPPEDILHDAQRMAEAARGTPSRTAIYDAATGAVVPVEHANLGPRRHRHHGIAPPNRPLRT